MIGRSDDECGAEASDPALEHVPRSDLVARSPAIPVQAAARVIDGPAVGNLAQSYQQSALVLAGIHTRTGHNPDPWRSAFRQAASGARPERANSAIASFLSPAGKTPCTSLTRPMTELTVSNPAPPPPSCTSNGDTVADVTYGKDEGGKACPGVPIVES